MELSWCILGPLMCKESLCGPVPILLRHGNWIVIYGTCLDDLPSGVVDLTPCDDYGVKLISVPVEYVARFLTNAEAEIELRKEETDEVVSHNVLRN